MIDSFTKWVEASIVPDKTAAGTASILLSHWICRFGIPLRLVSDNALSLTAEVIENLATDLQLFRMRYHLHYLVIELAFILLLVIPPRF
ncbi:integrase core domain protein [Gregarina niphandrodes]|uniref:Integrase core domain protein n=1 Tax=Gregarina niphandrodes TaxID=110365 RepID=A0A023AW80_GRENI|nr:integrase core domain protein [Gregarina niphandrodes]EZG42969.1 integrase core domain protein [Gregarina niphandrodes]|eukprot:XP_011133755.1 integrase core domain protein [Gregarina niphandrodes]